MDDLKSQNKKGLLEELVVPLAGSTGLNSDDLVRVLKSGGRMVIEEPDINHFGVKLVALAEKLLLMGSHFHTPVEIREMVAAHGLPARIETDGNFAAWVVADK